MSKQDVDKHVTSQKTDIRGREPKKYVFVAIISAFSTLGLVVAGVLLYQVLAPSTAISPVSQRQSSNSLVIQPGQYVQSAFGNQAQVELTAVRRISNSPDEVSVEMRITRLTDNTLASDIINFGSTTARDPLTEETYQAIDMLNRSSGTLSLYQMRRGQPVAGYTVLKIPRNVNRIDLFIDDAGAFKNVPITQSEQIFSDTLNSSANRASSTSLVKGTSTNPEP